jgi:hypothetical protein
MTPREKTMAVLREVARTNCYHGFGNISPELRDRAAALLAEMERGETERGEVEWTQEPAEVDGMYWIAYPRSHFETEWTVRARYLYAGESGMADYCELRSVNPIPNVPPPPTSNADNGKDGE